MSVTRHCLAALCGLAFLLSPLDVCLADIVFEQTNLVSSLTGQAPVVDANLKNPWGVAFNSTGPFWVANQVTGTATLYNGAGQRFPIASPLVVTIPKVGGGQGSPTGVLFNTT